MKNKDIQFFFNRPDRSVNSGRISGIRSGEYSNSSDIQIASSSELDEFLERFVETDVSASVAVPLVGTIEGEQDPTSASMDLSRFRAALVGQRCRFNFEPVIPRKLVCSRVEFSRHNNLRKF